MSGFPFVLGVLATSLALSLSTPAAAATTTCGNRTEAGLTVQEAVTRVRRKPRVDFVRRRTRNPTTNEDTSVATVTQGKQTVTETVVTMAADGSITTTRHFGQGFKGIREVVLRSSGGTREMTVDGRRISIAALEATPPALVFEDGGGVPRLRVKRAAARILRKADKFRVTSCFTGSTAVAHPLAQGDCDLCITVCWGNMFACEVFEVVACAATAGATCGIEVVGKFFKASASCGDVVTNCVNDCNSPGHGCCLFACGGACCGADASASNTVCVGSAPGFAGSCCSTGGACGSTCCDGSPGSFCADPATGRCCAAGETACGNICCDVGTKCSDASKSLCCALTGDGCGRFCCPAGERCVSPSDDDPDLIVCIPCGPDKSGPLCGETCCGAGEVCGAGNECCRPQDLCGGTCCDAAHCLNGTTCCKSGVPCGGDCCTAFGSRCCENGQCCVGNCIAGQCCPAERDCGPACCAPGNYCANRTSGQCVQCGPGEAPCTGSDQGGPSCCPTGQECCVAGCCSAGTVCCAPSIGGPLACNPGDQCVR